MQSDAEQAIRLALLTGLPLSTSSARVGTLVVWSPRCGVAALGREAGGWHVSEQVPPGRVMARRRSANVAGGRPFKHEVKVSAEQEARLRELADEQRVSIPRLLVESALTPSPGETVTERRNAMAELFALHRLLASVSNNVNQLAKVANATGEIPPEMTQTLHAARRVAERIDSAIDGLAGDRR